jgi:hypothetical protein
MKCLEVSGAVRPIYVSLSVKRLTLFITDAQVLLHLYYKSTKIITPAYRLPGYSPGKRFSEISKQRNNFIFNDQVASRKIEKYDPSDAVSHHRRPLILNYNTTKTSKKSYFETI